MENIQVNLSGELLSLDTNDADLRENWYKWVMVVLLWLVYVAWGVVALSTAPLVTPIVRDLDVSYAQMGLILGSWPLTYIIVAMIVGAIIDRWGIRKSLLAGAAIIGLSAALRYFANNFGTMLVVVALFGAGGPVVSIGAMKTIAVWFKGKSRGKAVGMYMTGPRIGMLLALALTNSLVMPLTGYSWRLTFVCYSLLVFVVALLWGFFAKDAKTTITKESDSIIQIFRGLFKVRNIRVILIMGFLAFATGHGFTNWLPKILETGGLSPEIAGFAASIPIAAAIPATLLVPYLVPPNLRGKSVAVCALLSAVTLLLVVCTSGPVLIAGLIFFGIANYSFLPLLLLILMDSSEVRSRYLGSAGGMFFCVAEIGGVIGPLAVGALVDMTGTFLAGVSFLVILTLIIFPMTLLLGAKSPPPHKLRN